MDVTFQRELALDLRLVRPRAYPDRRRRVTAIRPTWRIRALQRVVDQEAFPQLLDLELHKARRLGFCVAVVSIVVDPPGVERYGSFTRLAETVATQVRTTDLVAMVPPRFLALLLVDAPRASLRSIVSRLVAQSGLSDAPMIWSAGASCYPETRQRIEEMLEQATDLMMRAAADGGNRLYLP